MRTTSNSGYPSDFDSGVATAATVAVTLGGTLSLVLLLSLVARLF